MSSSEALKEYYINQVERHGYLTTQHTVSGTEIDTLFSDFQIVLHETFDEPGPMGMHIVNAFDTIVPNRENDSSGFIFQRRVGRTNPYEPDSRAGSEDKDTLHFTPQTYAHAEGYFAQNGGMPRIVRSLLSHCRDLHEATKVAVQPVLGSLGLADRLLAPSGYEHDDIHILRLIRYPAQDPTKTSGRADKAQLHFDRCKVTAALWESSQGLVGGPGNNGLGSPNLTVEEFDAMCERALLSPVVHTSHEAKVFTGAGYNHLPREIQDTSGNLPPFLHGVLNIGPTKERLAVVMFMNEHAGIPNTQVPAAEEKKAKYVREALAERQARYGGMVSP